MQVTYQFTFISFIHCTIKHWRVTLEKRKINIYLWMEAGVPQKNHTARGRVTFCGNPVITTVRLYSGRERYVWRAARPVPLHHLARTPEYVSFTRSVDITIKRRTRGGLPSAAEHAHTVPPTPHAEGLRLSRIKVHRTLHIDI